MKEFTIEIDCPEGWNPVAFRFPKEKESYVNAWGNVEECAPPGCQYQRLIVEKIKPVERVFRLVSERGYPEIGQQASETKSSGFIDWNHNRKYCH